MDEVAIPWERFSSDPRQEQNTGLRSSDLDRSVALDVLATAYGDGRLDREEYDERAASVQHSKTLGELVGPLRDLAPDQPGTAIGLSNDAELTQRATERYRKAREGALASFLVPTVICWAIWCATMFGGPPWPIFVMFSGVPLLRLLTTRHTFIDDEKRRLARREQRRIEQRPR